MSTRETWGWVASALLLLGMTSQGADNGGRPQGGNIEQRTQKCEERIDHRISMIKERLAKHPDAPAAVRSAADKLINDLMRAKGDLSKLAAAVEAHNKADAKTDRETLKQDHQAIQADREALKEAVHCLKGEHHPHPDGKNTAL
jgi:hypothetical protein